MRLRARSSIFVLPGTSISTIGCGSKPAMNAICPSLKDCLRKSGMCEERPRTLAAILSRTFRICSCETNGKPKIIENMLHATKTPQSQLVDCCGTFRAVYAQLFGGNNGLALPAFEFFSVLCLPSKYTFSHLKNARALPYFSKLSKYSTRR